jgi:hypothetical protein
VSSTSTYGIKEGEVTGDGVYEMLMRCNIVRVIKSRRMKGYEQQCVHEKRLQTSTRSTSKEASKREI